MKLKFLLWTGQQYTPIVHEYMVDPVVVRGMEVEVYARGPEKKDNKGQPCPESTVATTTTIPNAGPSK